MTRKLIPTDLKPTNQEMSESALQKYHSLIALSQEELKNIVDYDPITGRFAWRNPISKKYKSGDPAGAISIQGYNVIRIKGVSYRCGRLAWFYIYGRWPVEIDHIDRIKTNDAINNLREATSQQNKANRIASKSSVARGVYWHRNKYMAKITYNGKSIYLGTFDTEAEAVAAYKGAAKICFGEFTCA